MASDAVLKYLSDTNRPYSCADITVNLRGAYPKSAIQKALDALSESGQIKCKLYGKQKVFAAIQLEAVPDENDKEDYDTQIKVLTKSMEDKAASLKTAENNLKTMTSTPTTEAARTQIAEIKERIAALRSKLATLRSSTSVLSADEKRKLTDQHDHVMREYRKRKRIASDMIEAVMEGYPKSKKALLEDLCIETDDIVGFKLMSTV